MNQNIITYLNGNKEKYPKDVLIAELHKAGYSEGDIAEGVAQVFGGTVPAIAPVKTSFWNFKDKKVYTNASEKRKDFLFGVFGVAFLGSITIIIFFSRLIDPSLWWLDDYLSFISLLFFLFGIIITIYLFSRRRFIFYGMLISGIIIPPSIIVLFAITALSTGFRY